MIFSLSLLHSPKRLGHIYKHYLMSLCLQMASHHPVKTFLEVIPVLPSTHWTSANHSPVSDGIVPSRWSSEHSSISSCPTELSSFPLTKTHTGEERGCEGVFFFFLIARVQTWICLLTRVPKNTPHLKLEIPKTDTICSSYLHVTVPCEFSHFYPCVFFLHYRIPFPPLPLVHCQINLVLSTKIHLIDCFVLSHS